MASFCPKCGSAVPAGAGYCASCGTSIASTSAPGEPVPAAGYAPVNTQPGVAAGQYMPVAAPAPNTGPVPAKSGGGLKVVLIIVAIVAGIGAIAVGIVGYGVYRVVHTVKQAVVTDDKGNVTLNSPTGGISLGKNIIATEDELGLPIFPGATRGPGGMRVKNKTGSMITVVYRTDSDIDAVVAFYKSRMPDADETANDRNHATVLKSGPDSDQTMVVISPDTGSDKLLTSIMITRIKQVGK